MHIMYVSTYVYIYICIYGSYIYTIYVRKPWPEFAFLMIIMGFLNVAGCLHWRHRGCGG